eukprot:scaffold177153_cov37-Prasinocladus_malaysianus.AAC.1
MTEKLVKTGKGSEIPKSRTHTYLWRDVAVLERPVHRLGGERSALPGGRLVLHLAEEPQDRLRDGHCPPQRRHAQQAADGVHDLHGCQSRPAGRDRGSQA